MATQVGYIAKPDSFPAVFTKTDSYVSGSNEFKYHGINASLYLPYDCEILHASFVCENAAVGEVLTLELYDEETAAVIEYSTIPTPLDNPYFMVDATGLILLPMHSRLIVRIASYTGTTELGESAVTVWFKRKL